MAHYTTGQEQSIEAMVEPEAREHGLFCRERIRVWRTKSITHRGESVAARALAFALSRQPACLFLTCGRRNLRLNQKREVQI